MVVLGLMPSVPVQGRTGETPREVAPREVGGGGGGGGNPIGAPLADSFMPCCRAKFAATTTSALLWAVTYAAGRTGALKAGVAPCSSVFQRPGPSTWAAAEGPATVTVPFRHFCSEASASSMDVEVVGAGPGPGAAGPSPSTSDDARGGGEGSCMAAPIAPRLQPHALAGGL